MRLTRLRLFLLLLALVLVPFILYNLAWIVIGQKTIGTIRFHGKSYSGQLVNEYSVISFTAGRDTIWFNSSDGVLLKKGKKIPIYYMPNNPANARAGIFREMWGQVIFYASVPVLILLVAFLHPSLVPKRSLFKLSLKKPFVNMVPES